MSEPTTDPHPLAVHPTKAIQGFTGRGSFSLLRKQAAEQQSAVHLEMDALVQQSKVQSSPIYIQRHKKPSGAWMLRWRYVVGGAHRHALWPELSAVLDGLPLAIRKHCESLNQRALELNTLDIILEHTQKWCAQYLEHGTAARRGRPPSCASNNPGH